MDELLQNVLIDLVESLHVDAALAGRVWTQLILIRDAL